MGKFLDEYKKELDNESMQFMFLCSKSDLHMLVEGYKKKCNLPELARLGALTLVFGYKRLFMKICANVEKYSNEFLELIKATENNFALLENWVIQFISKIRDDEARKLLEEFWQQRKTEFDLQNFTISQLI
ncbi:MAG TPA: hypothetical protein DD415_01695 [Clostridiales bacterium]|nr:hypothetical protein [Clostridiales bacterium]